MATTSTDLKELAEALLSITAIADLSSETETNLYVVPTGKTLILTKAYLKVAGDVGASGVVTIGQNGAETDFIGSTNLDNLDANLEVILLARSFGDTGNPERIRRSRANSIRRSHSR